MIFLGYLKAFSHPTLIIFSLMAGIVSVYSYGYSASAPIYAQANLHLSPSHYGYWNLLNTLGMLISGFLSANFIKRMGVKNTLMIGIVCMVPFLISLIFLSICDHANTAWFFITTMCLFICMGFLFPTASYFASNAIEDRASASSVMSFINMGLATLSVVVIGYLPFSPLLSFIIVLCILFAATTVLVMRQIFK
jgi:MFS family permease